MTNTRFLSSARKRIPMLAAPLSCLMLASALAAGKNPVTAKEAAQPSIDIFKCTSPDGRTPTVYSDTPCDEAPPVMTLPANMNVMQASGQKHRTPVKRAAAIRPIVGANDAGNGSRAMMTDPKADKRGNSTRCANLEKRLDHYVLRQHGKNTTARQKTIIDEQIKLIEKQLQDNQC